MAGVRMLLLRWTADRGLLLVMVVVVALTAGLMEAVPRLLDRLGAASLDAAVDAARADRAGLTAASVDRYSPAAPAAALEALDRTAQDLTDELDADLAEVLEAPTTVFETTRYDLGPLQGGSAGGLGRKLTVRVHPAADDAVTLVEGALPDGVPGVHSVDRDDGRSERLAVREFVATAATAELLDMRVGDQRLGTPDGTGPVLRRLVVADVPTVVWELSGIVELRPPDDPIWFGDARQHRPSRFDTDGGSTVFATGILPAAAVGELRGQAGSTPASISVRWHLDAAALAGSDLLAVRQAATALRAITPFDVSEPRWSTGLDRLLATEGARRATAVEVLGIGAVAVGGVALALLAAMAAVLGIRRAETLALVRGRGASHAQLLVAGLVEYGVVVVGGGLLARVVLDVVLPATHGGPQVVPLVAAAALLVLLVAERRRTRRPLGALLAERRRSSPPSRRGLVLDGLVVFLAAIAASSLRRRGITADATVDPLLIVAPVLVALAIALVTARVLTVPLRATEAAARRSRAMAVPVGLARAARGGASGVVVVLLVLGLGLAGLASSIHTSVVDGQDRAADQRVGADVRIDAQPLGSLAPDWSPPSGDDDVADLRLWSPASLLGANRAQVVDVLLVEPTQLAAVGADEELPPLGWDGTGPVPLAVSDAFPIVGRPEVGDELTLVFGEGQRVAGEVVAITPRALGRSDEDDGAFVVLDNAAAVTATGIESGVTSRLVRTEDPDAVESRALDADPEAGVLLRERVRQELRRAPLARGVRVGYLVAALATGAATALALVMGLAARAPERRRQSAVLAALGTGDGRIRVVLLAEVVPAVAGAAIVGIVVSAAMVQLLDGRLDLSPFTGTVGRADLVLPHPGLALALLAGAILVAGGGVLLSHGRVDPGALLREGN